MKEEGEDRVLSIKCNCGKVFNPQTARRVKLIGFGYCSCECHKEIASMAESKYRYTEIKDESYGL